MEIFGKLREDVQVVFKRDPAARSTIEVITCYPGLHAVWIYRIGHALSVRGLRLMARVLSHLGRFLSGIEIHPGAMIGRRLFIDHGMGVVIGETAEIGDDVLLYQGVVLGGTSLEKAKRHPTLEDGVVVGAGSILLGAITIGAGARVGSGSVVVADVEPGAVVVGVPARATRKQASGPGRDLDHGMIPDPVANAIHLVLGENSDLKIRIEKLESLEGVVADMDRKMDDRHAELYALFSDKTHEKQENGSGI